MRTPNAQYNLAVPESFAMHIAARVRAKLYRDFIEYCDVLPDDTVLDNGATSDRSYASSNYLEALHPYKNKITASGVDDASFLENLYPGVKFVFGNGLNLPFKDNSFDFVHSSAVLEHVGCFSNQRRFISECARVSRKGFFLTTPNRWFPVEFHTQLPLIHWLPRWLAREAFDALGYEFFADEANLNLMSRNDLQRAADDLSEYRVQIRHRKLLGWPSNLLLIGRRLSRFSI